MLGRFAFRFADHSGKSAQQQVLQIPTYAIGAQQTQIMQVKIAFGVHAFYFFGVNFVQPVNFADFRGYIIVQPLQRVTHIAVFIYLPVYLLQVLVHQVHVKLGRNLTDACMLVAVQNISFGRFVVIGGQQYVFHNVLHVFHVGGRVGIKLLDNVNGSDGQLFGSFRVKFSGYFARFGDGVGNFF